jgi:hypothetical protein
MPDLSKQYLFADATTAQRFSKQGNKNVTELHDSVSYLYFWVVSCDVFKFLTDQLSFIHEGN